VGSSSGSDGGLPPQWHWFTVEQLASAEPRSIQSGPFGSNLKHSEFQDKGRLVIGIDNVQDGEFSKGANHRISEAKFRELSKYSARPRDVLITVMATIGRVCVVPDRIEPSIITKHVYRITVNRELAAPEYLAIALRGASEVRAQLLGSVQGQTRPGLNGTLIKQIRIPTPPVEEQHRIVAEVDRRLSFVNEAEAEVDTNLKRAQALRQAILQAAFSGRSGQRTRDGEGNVMPLKEHLCAS
jgi:type I restriction enzyme S subunit